ncbi:GH3 auxin-responsive promoter family protein [Fulvivirga ulvae]|uniref:GH3 family domain-containing protein n=1 Tax=Fulvivirga ulvae TaxID=2904245 RepID=UPI001F2E2EDF|nr:GH3 auxin-responsive promoter family protein [Fulvivirga ulvae]UII31408.1 GH3 auxin-responsive promoter family protein [Fulvivirga ulvae]
MTILGNIIKKAIELKGKLSGDDDPAGLQEKTLYNLLDKAKDTEFGRHFNFKDILKSDNIRESFAECVPVYHYNKMRSDWWLKMEQGQPDISWPGKPSYLALSSGTTSGVSKKIPVTEDMLQATRQASLEQITCLSNFNLPAEFFEKEILMLSSSTNLNEDGEYTEGDISGISTSNIPFWFRNYCRPGEEIFNIDDWDERIQKIAEQAPKWDIGALSGIPSWIELMLKKVMEYHGLSNIHEIWPNLRVYATGGVAFGPYQKSFEKLLAKPLIYIDTYFCSEGFLAFQARPETNSMKLSLDNGIYFEFVPFTEENILEDGSVKPGTKALTLEDIEEGEEYVLLISSVSGLWRYVLGDTVKLTSKERYEIDITGRTKHFLNVVGSKLSVNDMNTAIQALEEKLGVTITEFTVAAIKQGDHFIHKWYLGSEDLKDKDGARQLIDNTLRNVNHNYQTAREQALSNVVIEVVSPDVFYEWNEMKNKKGGQVKTARVMDEEQFSEWENFVRTLRVATG